VGDVDTGSLILIPPGGFPTAFLAFFDGFGLEVAFCLPARVLDTSSGGRVTVRLITMTLGQDWDSQGWNVTLKAGDERNETVQSLCTNNQGIRFYENKR
jgi:hypothetical protein